MWLHIASRTGFSLEARCSLRCDPKEIRRCGSSIRNVPWGVGPITIHRYSIKPPYGRGVQPSRVEARLAAIFEDSFEAARTREPCRDLKRGKGLSAIFEVPHFQRDARLAARPRPPLDGT